MKFAEITQDDLYDLGFEPMESENTKSIHYQHPELGIHLWKGMFSDKPEARFWKSGLGQDKIIFESMEQLQAYMAAKKGEE